MADINKIYEAKHLRIVSKTGNTIRLLFDQAILEISYATSYIKYKGGIFSLSKYPALKKAVEELLTRLHQGITVSIINSITESWDLSNQKNDVIVDRRLAGRVPTEAKRQTLYDPNLSARDAFIKRKEAGLNLSKRVWKSIQPFRNELERGLAVGISEGQPAAEIAKNLKRYLVEPDRLYRKVRDSKGKLQLSKAAREYHPGQGVARSSFSNSMRLAVTETNMSYRAADHERWQRLPFVTGYKVSLSNNHPRFDQCDHLAGIYPKEFRFLSWHPRCRCVCTPILVSNEQYNEIEDFTLGISDKKPDIKQVTEIPERAKDWFKANAERINNWSNVPYWKRDNPKYLKEIFNK